MRGEDEYVRLGVRVSVICTSIFSRFQSFYLSIFVLLSFSIFSFSTFFLSAFLRPTTETGEGIRLFQKGSERVLYKDRL
jgi:hypothetical protein